MKSAYFNALYKEQFRRLGLPMLLVSLVFATISIIDGANNAAESLVIESLTRINSSLFAFPFAAGLIAALCAFGTYNRRSRCDFYMAIPATRTTIFFSTTLAVVSWSAIGAGLSIAISAIFNLFGGFHIVQLAQYLVLFCFLLIATMLVYAMCSIGCIITGRLFSNVVMSQIVLWLPRFYIMLVNTCADSMSSEFVRFGFEPLNNSGQLATGILFAGVYNELERMMLSWWPYIYSLLLLGAALALGCWLFNRRKAELAEQSAESPRKQNIHAALFALPLWLAIAYEVLVEAYWESTLLLTLALLSLVFFIVYQSVCKRSFIAALKSLLWWVASAAVGAALVLVAILGCGLIDNVRLEAEDIEGVYFFNSISDYKVIYLSNQGNYSDYRVREVNLSDETVNELVASALDGERGGPAASTFVRLRIKLKSGYSIYRILGFNQQEAEAWTETLMANSDYQDAVLSVPSSSENLKYSFNNLDDYTFEEAERVYNALDKSGEYDYVYWDGEVDSLVASGYYGLEVYAVRYAISKQTPEALDEYIELYKERGHEMFELWKQGFSDTKVYSISLTLPDSGLYITYHNNDGYYYYAELYGERAETLSSSIEEGKARMIEVRAQEGSPESWTAVLTEEEAAEFFELLASCTEAVDSESTRVICTGVDWTQETMEMLGNDLWKDWTNFRGIPLLLDLDDERLEALNELVLKYRYGQEE
ncbi:MAG: hypothetical protein Q4C04_07960 [Clostridia bacterium]|nr:hypothetical protein [Clostridia bacterium]